MDVTLNQANGGQNGQGDVTARWPVAPDLPVYELTENDLGTGASLGNGAIWVNTKSTGALERLFSIRLGQTLMGAVSLRYATLGSRLYDVSESGIHDGGELPYVGLNPDAPARFEIHPAYQRRRFIIAAGIEVVETTWVPLCDPDSGEREQPIVYISVEMHNSRAAAHCLRIVCFARLRGALADDVEARFDPALKALVATNRSQPEAPSTAAARAPS